MTEPGDAIARGVPRRPARSVVTPLDPTLRPQEALRRIARSCIGHFSANLAGIDGPRPGEFLHQARIALRRLRSVLQLVRPSGPELKGMREEAKWLARQLGEARDWDVFIAGLQPFADAHEAKRDRDKAVRLLAAARRNRTRARKMARAALHSPQPGSLRARLERWLASPCEQHPQEPALREFAARELRRRHKRLLRLARGLARAAPQERHEVRVAAKRLRYIADYFGPLFAPKAAERYLRELAELQDALGILNDMTNAKRLAATLPEGQAATALIRKRSKSRQRKHLARACAALERIHDVRPFWKHQNPRRNAE